MNNLNYLYSASMNTFFIDGVHKNVPDDVVAITPEEHEHFVSGVASGKMLRPKKNRPSLVDFVPDPLTWNEIREKRDRFLTSSDWTQVEDNGMPTALKMEWRTYRQSLRDITDTFSKPALVVWPTPPGTKE